MSPAPIKKVRSMAEDHPQIAIYTDGAADPNPGRGGYGVVLLSGKYRKELSGGYERTTNNRMELMAVIVGLEALRERGNVTVYSDSKYVVDSINNGAAAKWRSNDWWRTQNQKAKNADLWERLLTVCEMHSVRFEWVPGHQGVSENERCDQLASEAAKSRPLAIDVGYLTPAEVGPRVAGQLPKPKSKSPELKAGDPCRSCGTPLEKATPKRKKRKPTQEYYFEWYLRCRGCRKMFMVESAKRFYDNDGPTANDTA